MSIAATGLVLAGCSNGDGSPHNGMSMMSSSAAPAPASAHNAADVTFAQAMIPHHQQAIEMAGLAASRSSNPKVKDLASRIQSAQDPEIQQMQTWLTQWGAAPSGMPSMPEMNHGSMPGASMPGMMTDTDMQKLQQAGGAQFDKMFLQMMVHHHQGAVEMAKTELAQGSNTDAKALARRIIDSQTAEITEMQQLLTTM
ncbi:DUF305 domain-containing protein [Amycolatopsis pithecellobii]|uniref:DUF305 domain-containing protein n=1 Tax=Amycolatopsis pithecellobii TaxID=664692 RepID=A0A6N7Z6L5_9PSEU|nr:DUF305 domain-containing protein [Amycolatopsis pithecellobii]